MEKCDVKQRNNWSAVYRNTGAFIPSFYRDSKAFKIQCDINCLLSLNSNGRTSRVIDGHHLQDVILLELKIQKLTSKKKKKSNSF